MTVPRSLEREVRARADGRCEYCRMHECLQGATFHVEHVRPRARGGATTLDDLALACPGCSLRKSDRTDAPDPQAGESLPLFDPRRDEWSDHFHWQSERLVPRSPVGRATLAALDLDHPRRILIRRAERLFRLFPS